MANTVRVIQYFLILKLSTCKLKFLPVVPRMPIHSYFLKALIKTETGHNEVVKYKLIDKITKSIYIIMHL